MGWIGVDFDGTLAEGHNIHKPGAPILPMLERVKAWLAEGKDVRIFTARVGPATREECLDALSDVKITEIPTEALDLSILEVWWAYQRQLIDNWCLAHLGQKLPITATKDLHCVQIWDDIAIQVLTNTGGTVLGTLTELYRVIGSSHQPFHWDTEILGVLKQTDEILTACGVNPFKEPV